MPQLIHCIFLSLHEIHRYHFPRAAILQALAEHSEQDDLNQTHRCIYYANVYSDPRKYTINSTFPPLSSFGRSSSGTCLYRFRNISHSCNCKQALSFFVMLRLASGFSRTFISGGRRFIPPQGTRGLLSACSVAVMVPERCDTLCHLDFF